MPNSFRANKEEQVVKSLKRGFCKLRGDVYILFLLRLARLWFSLY